MRDRDLYAQILGIASPWPVSDVRLDVPAGRVEVIVEHRGQACCPMPPPPARVLHNDRGTVLDKGIVRDAFTIWGGGLTPADSGRPQSG